MELAKVLSKLTGEGAVAELESLRNDVLGYKDVSYKSAATVFGPEEVRPLHPFFLLFPSATGCTRVEGGG